MPFYLNLTIQISDTVYMGAPVNWFVYYNYMCSYVFHVVNYVWPKVFLHCAKD